MRLVTLVANSGAWVTKLTLSECVETYLIRERLEPLLLRTSMPALDPAAVGRLGQLADQMEAGAGLDAFMRADREFHLSSYAGAASTEMGQIIHRMWNTTQHYRREFTRLAMQGGLSATHLEHRLLLDCIRRVHAGETCIPPSVVAKLAASLRSESLSARELEVLTLLARGQSNKEIAMELRISETTVKSHLRSLFAKLDVLSRTEAITVASRRGLVRL